jgi:hypothetical protein
MDDDLLITNSFIPFSYDTGNDMSIETKRHKVIQYVKENEDALKSSPRSGGVNVSGAGIVKPLAVANRGMSAGASIDTGSAPGTLEKEERVIISVNSNQRSLTTETDLADPLDYFNYVAQSNYQEFQELYNLAKELNRNILTYDDYAAQNGAPIIANPNPNIIVRNIVNRLLVASRDFPNTAADINSSLLSLVTIPAVNTNGRADYESMANLLNAFVMSGSAFNPSNFWRPFYFTGYTNNTVEQAIKQIVYKDQLPSQYSIVLPRIIDHVKSIRLVSTEIPNTVNNITERNNIITIQLKYYPTPLPPVLPPNTDPLELLTEVPLDPTVSAFNFILIKIDVGVYTLDSLLKQMKKQINDACKLYTYKKYADLFDITWNSSNGVINIFSNRKDVYFHLKFYSELTGIIDIINPGNPLETLGKSHGVISSYVRDLWFLLGFPWPYEISANGANKYTQYMTNQVAFGVHDVLTQDHINNDIFDRDTRDLDKFTNDEEFIPKASILNTYRPYKFPDITVKYIYLAIKGFKSINHVNQFNGLIEYKDTDIFAKILLSDNPGDVCYNTFVDNPLIFVNAKDKIETLDITWVDEQGQPVDFNKVDHSFTLEMVHYVTQLEGNGYSTTLGTIDRKSYPSWLANNY